MVTEHELLSAVDAAFAITGRGFARWADPDPAHQPTEEQYSRVTDAEKWRIVGARADAWLAALADTGLAVVEDAPHLQWRRSHPVVLRRVVRATPRVAGGIPLIVARSPVGEMGDAGVTLGVGDPAIWTALIPDCGCDACDSGSQDVLDEVDANILRIVSGESRRLWQSGRREIMVSSGGDRMSAGGIFAHGEVDSILASPAGWLDYSGASWLTG